MKLNKVVDGINYCTTIIKTYEKENNQSVATGFFYRIIESDTKFLITNKHVVSEKDSNPEYIEIRLHKEKEELENFNLIRINLKENGKNLWLEYPDINVYCDVVAIPLSKDTMPIGEYNKFVNSKVNFFTRDNINKIMPAQFGKLAVIGYPKNFYDKIHNLPIYRQATLASQYTINFMNEPFFLIDGKMHNGMSGLPVISSGTATYDTLGFGGNNLFGIFSDEWETGGESLGLNTVWYAQILLYITNDKIE